MDFFINLKHIIFHIDLDAFFASVEENQNHTLKGKPIIVVGRHRKSVVSCANYKAREFGITSAMPVSIALKKCPNVKLINADFQKYSKASDSFKNFLIQNISPFVEDFSIDECFIDVTNYVNSFDKAVDFAKELQLLIQNKLNLSASIGISNNKFLAKMATEMNKPMGITLLLQCDVKEKVWPLPISKMLWIGSSIEKKLLSLGIKTIGDLANWKKLNLLEPIFGKRLSSFISNANGYGDTYIDNKKNISRSISISKTLFEDIDNYDDLKTESISICKELYKKMWEKEITGKTIILGLKSNKWEYKTKSITIEEYVLSENKLIHYVLNLLNDLFEDYSIRLISIGIQNLKSIKEIKIQNSLFDKNNNKNWLPPTQDFQINNFLLSNNDDLLEIANKINNKIGKEILYKASVKKKK
ncbi:DNA polymerase IV [Mycoplasmoides alvi]|uniref:DNA polymerase IV n=1 Tax=Mycoplasmoides alvi TaxID=78580 RepID=UPI00051C2687|nr:DNA polymerase IV [Mycoplasmoides alvi]